MVTINRRSFLAGTAAGTLGTAFAGKPMPPRPAQSRDTLLDPAFRPLPLGSIRPLGWLQRQLRIQADGLSGHLDEFWPDVGQSKWFGGTGRGLGARSLLARRRHPAGLDPRRSRRSRPKSPRTSSTSSRISAPDGWFSPYPEDAVTKRYDLWAILLANKMLVQYHEATGDERVLKAVESSLRAMHDGLDRTPLYDWGSTAGSKGSSRSFTSTKKPEKPGSSTWPQAARAGLRLPGILQGRRHHRAHAPARPVEMGQARRQHRHGGKGVRSGVAP